MHAATRCPDSVQETASAVGHGAGIEPTIVDPK